MRKLSAALLFAILLSAACAGPPRVEGDGWGIERRFDGRSPALISISEINAGSTPKLGEIARVPVRARERGRYRIAIGAEQDVSKAWTSGAALFDPHLDRALERLAALGAAEARGVELRLTLVPVDGARKQRALHAAHRTLVIDLLVPVSTAPRSRGAELDAALATGLHEAAHALRPAHARDRHDDEYRASLVAACFRIDSAQRGDVISFRQRTEAAAKEFTQAHSRAAAQAVQRDLAGALGNVTLNGGNRDGIAALQDFCRQRLAQPPR